MASANLSISKKNVKPPETENQIKPKKTTENNTTKIAVAMLAIAGSILAFACLPLPYALITSGLLLTTAIVVYCKESDSSQTKTNSAASSELQSQSASASIFIRPNLMFRLIGRCTRR